MTMTHGGSPLDTDHAAGQEALQRGVERLLSMQHEGGWWHAELATNVTMDAEDLLMREFLGVRTAEQTEQSARWIRSQQRSDGSWATFYGGPPDLSTTVEAYLALKLAGDGADEPHLKAAREVVLDLGGLEQTRVFTRIWLSLFGLWDWAEVPALPPEMIFLPKSAPLNVYNFSCWARQTIVPLTILSALRSRRPIPVRLGELYADPRTPVRPQGRTLTRAGKAFHALDRVLQRYEKLPRKPLRQQAIGRCAEWIIARQEADGGWGGIQPPWVYSLMALHELGYALDHPVIAQGLQGWERFTIREDTPEGPIRRIEACQSPVWDTALALIALGDAGVDRDHPALAKAGEWLCDEEIRVRGDWAVRRPTLPAGGWAFEFDNDNYPDIDDTAEIVMALHRTPDTPRAAAASQRGIAWVEGMQCSDGGWAAFDVDNTDELAYQIPFCDFGAVIDPPSSDVTGHVVEMLAREGRGDGTAARRGVQWLLDHQQADGSWYGRWGANYVYGTGAAVPALVLTGHSPDSAPIRRAVQWLESRQNADGGWGEDLRSYEDASWAGRGESMPSQTAWALIALEAAGQADGAAARRGVDWLVRNQEPDGGWDEPYFTGTGFPGDFYINYHLYRMVFPISALARCLRSRR
ncbi:MAG TPA: squalene--hopene cyclase [Segeticoccus sp.]|uniref:squalene--hopene cyclase n=1 Tax=Segeticoccus sp. TaxID=2706531 RepID=UPI002D7E263D|nr:squalene--hopene cyclase [Segeticoccus sp.]HET8600776.1 squalene--hopene cyclase [Segeticoccus sp.]